MENVITLGKIVKSVVLFPPPFYFVFDISNLLSYIKLQPYYYAVMSSLLGE